MIQYQLRKVGPKITYFKRKKIMTNDTATQDTDQMTAFARALWRSTREAPEGETPEARKEAWKAESKASRKLATQVLKRLERAGFTISKT